MIKMDGVTRVFFKKTEMKEPLIMQAYFTSDKYPEMMESHRGRSVTVIIDMNGDREHFETGFYSYDLGKWMTVSSLYWIKSDKMLWTYIP